jgi:hypothetical protein
MYRLYPIIGKKINPTGGKIHIHKNFHDLCGNAVKKRRVKHRSR